MSIAEAAALMVDALNDYRAKRIDVEDFRAVNRRVKDTIGCEGFDRAKLAMVMHDIKTAGC